MFSFALSGPCKELTMEAYIQAYSDYLSHYRDSLLIRKGYIKLDYYSFTDTCNVLVDSIIDITKRNLKTSVTLSDIEEGYIKIKVGDGFESAPPLDNQDK